MRLQPHHIEPKPSAVYLGLGSNLGDRATNLARALTLLEESGCLRITEISSLYETEPVGQGDQPWFLNAVARAETALAPEDLLRLLKSVERDMGRVTDERLRGPRVMDIDILLYGSRVVRGPGLTIPHPEIAGRKFVLVPLAELAPNLIHPVHHRPIANLLKHLADTHQVARVGVLDDWAALCRDRRCDWSGEDLSG